MFLSKWHWEKRKYIELVQSNFQSVTVGTSDGQNQRISRVLDGNNKFETKNYKIILDTKILTKSQCCCLRQWQLELLKF